MGRMKHPRRRPEAVLMSVTPLIEGRLIDAFGQITPAGRRRSNRLMDHTMARLRSEAEGHPEPVADVLPFRLLNEQTVRRS